MRQGGSDMPITDVFDAAQHGTYDEFCARYAGDPNVADGVVGHRLLTYAVLGRQDESERERVIARVLADGADVNLTTKKGEDCLMLCLKQGARWWSPEGLAWLTRMLVASGLDVSRRDAWGNDALMLSVRNTKGESAGLVPVWQGLLGAGADPTVAGPQGKSALDWAGEFAWRHEFLDVARGYGYGS